jgi:hypothetical protein
MPKLSKLPPELDPLEPIVSKFLDDSQLKIRKQIPQ